jgi:hypothetical protein
VKIVLLRLLAVSFDTIGDILDLDRHVYFIIIINICYFNIHIANSVGFSLVGGYQCIARMHLGSG